MALQQKQAPTVHKPTNAQKAQGKSNNKEKKKKINTRIPRDTFETIPYRSVYPNGIIEDYDKGFSKTYKIADTNFATEDEESRQNMYLTYEKLLNSLSVGTRGQITIFNRSIDTETVRNNILMKPSEDGHNGLRDEWNDLFLYKMQEGRNNLEKEKYFTVSVDAENVIVANDALTNMDRVVTSTIRRINKEETPPLDVTKRLELLYNIYNPATELSFAKKIEPIAKNGKLDLEVMAKNGISTKDLISPDGFEFNASNFILSNTTQDMYCRAYYLDSLPNVLNTKILDDLTNLSCNMIVSATYVPMDASEAMKLMKNQNTSINAQIATIERQNQGIGTIPTELEHARDAAKDLIQDVMSRDQKIFKVTVSIILMCETMEDLGNQQRALDSVVKSHMCQLRKMTYQQEITFNTAIPLAQVQVNFDRVLTTESASVFIPFTVQELNQPNGIWYGQNALSHNMIRYDRKTASNYNGLITGKPGSGKSYFAKEEISQVILNSKDDVIIIDPEGEYTALGRELGATIIYVDLNSKSFINPLDLNLRDENPVASKCDSILSLVESMVGGDGILSAVDKNIIQRVGTQIYRGYYNHMKPLLEKGITCDKQAMPTLVDFYEALLKQKEPNAQILATAIENYCVGNYNVFSHRTNVDVENRIIIYNVRNMVGGVKELAMKVCMSDAWNRIIENGRKQRYTRLYIDEFHLFTKTHSSATYMKDIYKRARKWKGIPTAMTQNIGDLLVNEEAVALVNNCDFVVLMNQSPMDRQMLANMYNISSDLQEYITDRGFGMGLIYNGKTMIPFENSFNEDTEMHRLMNSKDMEIQG